MLSSISETLKKVISKGESEDSKEDPVKAEKPSEPVANAEAPPEPPIEAKVKAEQPLTSTTTTTTSTTDQKSIPEFSSMNMVQKHLFNSTASAADMLVKSEDFQSLATVPPANYVPRQTTGSTTMGSTDTVNHDLFNSSTWTGALKAAHEDVNYTPTIIFKSTAATSAGDAATFAAAAIASASEAQTAVEGDKKPRTDLDKLLENKLNPFGKKPPAPKVPSLAESTAKTPAGPTRKRKSSEPDTSQANAVNYIKNSYTDNDVLMGKGGRSNHHPGNQRYLKQKLSIQPRYKAATKDQKTAISQELVDAVHSWGGRFLKLDEDKNMWFEVDNKTARKKASQTLREENTAESRAAKRAKYQKDQKAQAEKTTSLNVEV